MLQQINLYQTMFRVERKPFSATTMGTGLAVIFVMLLAMWGFGAWKLRLLEAELQLTRHQQQEQERLANAAGTLMAAGNNAAEVEARVKALKQQLAERTQALALLRGGAAGQPIGFVSRLEALARQHVAGLWLDRMVLAGDTRSLSLSGRSLDPDQVPNYLLGLSHEPALAGARFDEFAIERGKDGGKTVKFTAASAALAVKEQSKEEGP